MSKHNNKMKRRIQHCLMNSSKGYSIDKLAAAMHLKRREKKYFLFTLSKMEQNGEIYRGKKGRYKIPVSLNNIKVSHNVIRAKIMSILQGFGFARPESGGADCYIGRKNFNGALPGDTVLIELKKEDDRGPKGKVVKVLESGGHLYSGRLVEIDDGKMDVIPDAFIRYALPVLDDDFSDVESGDKVRFSVEYNDEDHLIAHVVTSYGSADSAHICADAIIDSVGIPSVFPQEVREEAKNRLSEGISDADLQGRTDLRDWTIFTIDGYDAKDLDDAVSLDEIDGGWRLGVHIADVSHYVRENSMLDAEARRRCTSVYFADRVIPMLPEELSNGICSLGVGEDKLTLSAIMTLDKNGVCTDAVIRKTIISSCVRGVYSEINELFDGTADAKIQEKYAPVRDKLFAMRELSSKLRDAAAQRGTMDLISTESCFELDEQGHPVEIFARTMGESEGMIEQFMIAANVAVAAFARKRGIPFVYRIHEQPDPEKLRILSETAQRLGLKNIKLSTQLEMRTLMEEARKTSYARLVSDRLLRSMAKARYSENALGHYGLALKDYCHFTSPIRRYPDLSIHRIISDVLTGISTEEIARRYTSFVRESADLSSQYEIRAMTAERECESCYKAEYMSRFIGDVFEGVISSVSSFGIFVELPNSVEGMIRLEHLPEEYMRYDDVASLVDKHGRPVYTIGDSITIRVDGTDVSTGRIDFSLAEQEK